MNWEDCAEKVMWDNRDPPGRMRRQIDGTGCRLKVVGGNMVPGRRIDAEAEEEEIDRGDCLL